MQKLQNDTLQKFLDNFINELKRENNDREYHETRKLDIPFIILLYIKVSTIIQISIKNL